MIKIQNNVATRDPLPAFLIGLAAESLADLSWTDPALGVADCAWWPEEDQSPALGQYQRYGDETLTIDAERSMVVVMRSVVAWSAEEIAADVKSRVPQQVTRRQGLQQLRIEGFTEADIEAKIALLPISALQKDLALIEFRTSQTFERPRPLVATLGALIGKDTVGLDTMFTLAAALP